jgi:hypothetical protein
LGGGCICHILEVVFSKNETGRERQVVVVPSKGELFGVKSFNSIMGCHDDFRFPGKSVWRTKVSFRVNIFVWSAALWNILTIDNLRKRQIIVVDWCVMCKKNRESVHLLLH